LGNSEAELANVFLKGEIVNILSSAGQELLSTSPAIPKYKMHS
jgi:hypothetical protein